MSSKELSNEECEEIRSQAEPTGVTSLREDRTVTQFLKDEFEDILEDLRPYTRTIDREDLEEAGVTLWYNPDKGEWYSTGVYTQNTHHLTRIHRPSDMKYEISIHTHEALSLGMSPNDVLQLVPFTDDSQNAVGPMEGAAVLSKDLGGFQLFGYERTDEGRAVNDLEVVQEKVSEAEQVLEECVSHDDHAESVREAVLRVYGNAVTDCHTTWIPSDVEEPTVTFKSET